ncbi:MAG: pyridoxamine 5'-phosphate oxidase [Myxococcales bacterium FL481]|nr:MAG: pyridoxamine 5'-phosphate oxidase [Myxococcales bacterium FL481]
MRSPLQRPASPQRFSHRLRLPRFGSPRARDRRACRVLATVAEVTGAPWSQLAAWLASAIASNEPRPRSFALATADGEGRPHVRFVDHQPHLASYDEIGFVTHFGSGKGRQLAAVPFAAGTFFWPRLRRQLRVEGSVVLASDTASDAYHRTRARESQLTAWATRQSSPLADRDQLERALEHQRGRWSDQKPLRPPHWGGYLLRPDRVEFWTAGPHRRHCRTLWERDPRGRWQSLQLQP